MEQLQDFQDCTNENIERLKEKLWKYFIASGSTQWIDIINKIIKNYKNTEIQIIGCTPTQASNHLIQSILINKSQEKTNQIENKILNIILVINVK